jgi:hypothetical protein
VLFPGIRSSQTQSMPAHDKVNAAYMGLGMQYRSKELHRQYVVSGYQADIAPLGVMGMLWYQGGDSRNDGSVGKFATDDVKHITLWLDLNSMEYGSSSIDPDEQARQRAGEIVWPKLNFDMNNRQRTESAGSGAVSVSDYLKGRIPDEDDSTTVY